MYEEIQRRRTEMSWYRFERAENDLRTAKLLYDSEEYRTANNRAYYSIFHSLRSVLALEPFDSKRHSGVISHFQKNYIKSGIFPVEISDMVRDAFKIRNDSDYEDMFIVNINDTRNQIENAEYILNKVREYLGETVDYYRGIFEVEGSDRDSQTLNKLFVSLFSNDTPLSVNDCNRSIRELMKIRWAIEDANISDEMKKHWDEYAAKGIDICCQNRERMENRL